MTGAETQTTEVETDVYHWNDEGNPTVAADPICNGCETTTFPEGNVDEHPEIDDTTIKLHICVECGAFTATELPEWTALGSSHMDVASTTEGWFARDRANDRVAGPAEKFEALAELGYDREDVKDLFDSES